MFALLEELLSEVSDDQLFEQVEKGIEKLVFLDIKELAGVPVDFKEFKSCSIDVIGALLILLQRQQIALERDNV